MILNAVGIDVSKRKSTVAVLRPGGEVVAKPFDVPHLSAEFQSLVDRIRSLDGETRIVMECTGRYYEPVARELTHADFFVSAVNPQIIHDFQEQDNPLRKVKTDKANSVKIARFTLDSWAKLKQYNLMDELRSQLKTMNRQFDFYMKHKTAMKNNLVGLIDQTYPGANAYFDSPAREDGNQKWVDFIDTYWHADCVRNMSLAAFTDHYRKWCARKTKPDDAVYLFMDRKRAEGKPYYVYMTAGANKFLRVYYGRVREYLASLNQFPAEEAESNGISDVSL